jgi:hypothetical protein
MFRCIICIFIIVYQIHLCRNQNGDADPNGSVWGAPYRWGTLVIAYKKNMFKRHNLEPIQVIFFLKSMQHSTKLHLLLVLIEVDYHVIYKWISWNLCHTLICCL